VLDLQPDIRDTPDAIALPRRVAGRVTFEDVRFHYSAGRPVLEGVSFDAAPGSRIALVGASGVGKTTVASLLVRFYESTGGRILIDGHDIRSVRLESLRSQIAMVLQDPVLFGTSVRENIAYGSPDASTEAIVRASELAGAHDFIAALPDGYESSIGERGVFLSGGQRQRIAIARAFLKDAPILLMDEPTSALDGETEAQLLDTIRRLIRGRTTITIAHRLSTIRDADQILVFQGGRICEAGSSDELLRLDGVYASLYRKQFSSGASSSEILA